MREIADGLGSGVTPEQLETSVELGKQWLEEIKQYDFSDERQNAIEKQMLADNLVETVNEFASPVKNFNHNVTEVEGIISELEEKLQDLDEQGRKSLDQVSSVQVLLDCIFFQWPPTIVISLFVLLLQIQIAKDYNFRNSDPPASFKTARINSMKDATEANNRMGTDLVNEANVFLEEAQSSFQGLADKREILDQTFTDSNDKLESDRCVILLCIKVPFSLLPN